MPKWIHYICVLILLAIIASMAAGSAPPEPHLPIRVFVNGVLIDFPDQHPVIVDGRTLVPLRGVFEAMGANVVWEPEAKRVTIRWNGSQVAVFVGSRTAWVNGEQRTVDTPPRILNGRTMVPVRFIAEAFRIQTRWDAEGRAVVIGTRPTVPALSRSSRTQLKMPCTVRVQMNPMGRREPQQGRRDFVGTNTVREVELSQYVADVLAHEMGDITTPDGVRRVFTQETRKAGALAVLMYAWYYAWNPAYPDYDLNNSKDFQVYISGMSSSNPKYKEAVNAIWDHYMVRRTKDGSDELFPPQYGTGTYSSYADGRVMGQLNALYMDQQEHYTWQAILEYFYRNVVIGDRPGQCAGPV